MPAVNLYHGSPLYVDHTPSGALSAGDVVEVNDFTLIVHSDIAASSLGAVAARGGVYKATAGEAITAGDKVYWDDAAGKVVVTASAGAHRHLGRLEPDSSASGDGDIVSFIHEPDGSTI